MNKTKIWFCERVNKFDKPMARLPKNSRERIQTKVQLKEMARKLGLQILLQKQ